MCEISGAYFQECLFSGRGGGGRGAYYQNFTAVKSLSDALE